MFLFCVYVCFISSQIPLDKWHDTIGDPTIAV
jgi:hypothetical protein